MRIAFAGLILMVCGACLFAVPQSPPPADPQQAEMIDFDALHAQAADALARLQLSRKNRVAAVATEEF